MTTPVAAVAVALSAEQLTTEIAVLKDRIAELELENEDLVSKQKSKKGGGGDQLEMVREFAKVFGAELKEALRPDSPGDRSKPKPRPLEAKHMGTKQYIVGPSGHWRGNKLYKQGEIVTITDQRPAKDWKLAPGQEGAEPEQKSSPPLSKPVAAKRANDIDVG